MSKRIHLSPDERREQILRGALKAFAEKGFDAVTNKEIAKAAGLASPGLIYHYFDSKLSLLRAVVEMTTSGSGATPEENSAREAFLASFLQMPLEEGLRGFVRFFLREISDPEAVAFVRVLMGEAMRRPEFATLFSDLLVTNGFLLVQTFFEEHQRQGAVRAGNSTALTLRFVGALSSLFIMREALKIPVLQALDADTIEDAFVEDFLRGVVP